MDKQNFKSLLWKYLTITIGSVVYAAAVSFFLDPNGIVPGGFTGIAMIIGHYVPIKTGTMTLILNIPVIALGIWKFGLKFWASTVYSVALSSVMIDLFALIGPLTSDLLLSALAGGFLMAIGLELVLKEGATTGGTDIIVKLLRTKIKHLSAGSLFTITDGLIVLISAIVFKNIEVALYAVICIVVYSKVIDLILYGRDEAKMLLIVSDKYEIITKRLLVELDAGATFLDGTGAYSGEGKRVVLCVIRKHLAPRALKIVKVEDPLAFTIITTANEVFGEGYKMHDEGHI